MLMSESKINSLVCFALALVSGVCVCARAHAAYTQYDVAFAVYMSIHSYICLYVCNTYIRMYVCMHACMYVCMYVRTYIRMCMNYRYVCTMHRYTHTLRVG